MSGYGICSESADGSLLNNNKRAARMANPTDAIAFNKRVGSNCATAPPANDPNRLVNSNAPAAPKNTARLELERPESAIAAS